MRNPFIPKKEHIKFETIQGQSKGILNDEIVGKDVQTVKGQVYDTPVNVHDIVNKEYADSLIADTIAWGDITASGANVVIYGGSKVVSGAGVQIEATGGSTLEGSWGNIEVSGSNLAIWGGTNAISGSTIKMQNTSPVINWGNITASGAGVVVYGGSNTVSGAVQIEATGGAGLEGSWSDLSISGSNLAIYGGSKCLSGSEVKLEYTGGAGITGPWNDLTASGANIRIYGGSNCLSGSEVKVDVTGIPSQNSWGNVEVSGSNLVIYGGSKAISGATIKIENTGGAGLEGSWGNVQVSGSNLAVYGGINAISGATVYIENTGTGGVTDHGALTGLGDDDHTQYVILAGRAGGQDIWGGAAHYGRLILPNAADGVTYIGNTDGEIWLYCNHVIKIISTHDEIEFGPQEFVRPDTDNMFALGDSITPKRWKSLALSGPITGCTNIVSPPTGGIIMWGTNTAPTGWLLCDGTAVSETTYAALFAVIGYTFGNPGEGYFNLPDWRLLFPVGSDIAGGTRPVGTTGGDTIYTPTGSIDNHEINVEVSLGGMWPNVVTGPLTHMFTGDPATIEPPYLAINFIIKY